MGTTCRACGDYHHLPFLGTVGCFGVVLPPVYLNMPLRDLPTCAGHRFRASATTQRPTLFAPGYGPPTCRSLGFLHATYRSTAPTTGTYTCLPAGLWMQLV